MHIHSTGHGNLVDRPLAAGVNGQKFDSPMARHVQRLISRVFTYSAVGSLVI